ncbi:transcriptional regulator domain-containing protein [Burkholderia gladioli]|uniref:transcriptional regulator domain-containing protein n=1 Tax=Burkholderia gladioli TaxID=28095 RepID=UPI00163F1A3C|nr:hypothetical protein [Burkholderia gladioli]
MTKKLNSTSDSGFLEGLVVSNKSLRSSGKDVMRYTGYETWSYRRWAWEFLRRNGDFIQACANLPDATDEGRSVCEAEVSRRFHLKKFKHCDDPYGRKLPVFNEIVYWRAENGRSERKLKVALRQDQLLVRFELEPALHARKALNVQLDQVRRVLENQLEELANERNIELSRDAFRVGSASDMLRWLRMLDLKLYAKIPGVRARGDALTDAQIYQLLFPDESKKKIDDEDCAEAFKDAYRTPMKLAEGDYLKLAIKDQEARLNRSFPSVR